MVPVLEFIHLRHWSRLIRLDLVNSGQWAFLRQIRETLRESLVRSANHKVDIVVLSVPLVDRNSEHGLGGGGGVECLK